MAAGRNNWTGRLWGHKEGQQANTSAATLDVSAHPDRGGARTRRGNRHGARCRGRAILPPFPRESAVSHLTIVAALLGTALAAWLSQGTLALQSDGVSRVALLPLSISSAVVVAIAVAGVW